MALNKRSVNARAFTTWEGHEIEVHITKTRRKVDPFDLWIDIHPSDRGLHDEGESVQLDGTEGLDARGRDLRVAGRPRLVDQQFLWGSGQTEVGVAMQPTCESCMHYRHRDSSCERITHTVTPMARIHMPPAAIAERTEGRPYMLSGTPATLIVVPHFYCALFFPGDLWRARPHQQQDVALHWTHLPYLDPTIMPKDNAEQYPGPSVDIILALISSDVEDGRTSPFRLDFLAQYHEKILTDVPFDAWLDRLTALSGCQTTVGEWAGHKWVTFSRKATTEPSS